MLDATQKLMGIVALLMCLTLVAPTVTIEAATTIYNNQTGTQDGYNYELWKDYGTTSMTLNGGGTFSASGATLGMRYSVKERNSTRPRRIRSLAISRLTTAATTSQTETLTSVYMAGQRVRLWNSTS